MKTMGELPPYIRNPGKADSLVRLQPCPGNPTQWGKVSSTGEHYSEPVSFISSLSPFSIPISSGTALGMQLTFHATACSHPVPLMLAQTEVCVRREPPYFPMHFPMQSACRRCGTLQCILHALVALH